MKKFDMNLLGLLALLIVIGLYACDDMDDNFEQYIQNGEVLYLPRPLNVKTKSGNKRIEITWKLTSTHDVKEAVISWNDGNLAVPVNAEDTVKSVIIPDLAGGNYIFELYTRNNASNQSLVTDGIVGVVYDEKFRSSLKARPVEKIYFDDQNRGYMKFTPAGELTRDSEVRYIDLSGALKSITVKRDSIFVELPNIDATKGIAHRTFFVPTPSVNGVETSIDAFDSDWFNNTYSKFAGVYLSTGQMDHYQLAQPVTWVSFEKEYEMVNENTIIGRLGNNWPSSRNWKIIITVNGDNSIDLAPADGLSDTLEKVAYSVNAYNPATKEIVLNYRLFEGGFVQFNETLVLK